MEFRIHRGLQDKRHPMAYQMRRHAEAHPCGCGDPTDVPEGHWRHLGNGVRVAFWCRPDGTEHLVLRRPGEKPPGRRTVRCWHWLFWPPGASPSLELRVEDGQVWLTHTPGQPATRTVTDEGCDPEPQSTEEDLAWDDETGKIIDRNTGLPTTPQRKQPVDG